jgi:hypothetical protein
MLQRSRRFHSLICLIAQRDNPKVLFRGLKLAANSPCGAQPSYAPRPLQKPGRSTATTFAPRPKEFAGPSRVDSKSERR